MIRSDEISALIRQTTEFIGVTHPLRLGAAAFLGLTSHGVIRVLARNLHDEWLTAAADLSSVYYMAVWAAIFVVPLAFGWRGAPESGVRYIRTLRLLIDQTDFTVEERRNMWRLLVYKYLQAASPDLSHRPSAKSLLEDIAPQMKPPKKDAGT
jgi:hypothetical protein